MPRRRRHDDISEGQLALIERHIFSLGAALDRAQLSLTPFKPHYDAISDLKRHMREAMNLLMDRPIDYERPHAAPMSGPVSAQKLQEKLADDMAIEPVRHPCRPADASISVAAGVGEQGRDHRSLQNFARNEIR